MLRRLNLPNPMCMNLDFEFELKYYPRKSKTSDWDSVPLIQIWDHLQSMGLTLNIMSSPSQENIDALHDLELGNFLIFQVQHFSMLIKKMEIRNQKITIKNQKEYLKLLREKPSQVEIKVRRMTKAPDQWDSETFGPFPESMIVVVMKIPSQNQKVSNKRAYKNVWLFLSDEPNQKLNLHEPLKQLRGWKCTNTNGRPDLCDRQAGMNS